MNEQKKTKKKERKIVKRLLSVSYGTQNLVSWVKFYNVRETKHINITEIMYSECSSLFGG